MDIWEPYAAATRACVPGAEHKIVHDPFHLLRHMNEAVNDVRKGEHRALQKLGDTRLAGEQAAVAVRLGKRAGSMGGPLGRTARPEAEDQPGVGVEGAVPRLLDLPDG